MTFAFEPPPSAKENSPSLPADSQILIAFDDLSAYRRAVCLVARVFAELNDGSRVRLAPWRFNALERPEWRRMATMDAQDADIVIIAATDAGGIATAMYSWIREVCGAQRASPALLVGLLGATNTPAQTQHDFQAYLEDVARETGYAFLAPATDECSHDLPTPDAA